MALTGDRYVGTYEGHTIDLVRNNWVKTLTLLIDGKAVASESCLWPGRITLSDALEHSDARHAVVAKSVPRYLLWTTDTVEVDGKELALTKTN
jgi:hypothetical protein